MSDTKTQACQWKYCESECSWDTQCDNKYLFMNDGPKENDYKFCPGCGKPVTLAGDEQPVTPEPKELKALASATGYEATLRTIKDAPLTWLGGIMACCVEECVRRKFFRDADGMKHFVNRVLENGKLGVARRHNRPSSPHCRESDRGWHKKSMKNQNTNDSETPAAVAGVAPWSAKPCEIPCPKCGGADIYREHRGHGESVDKRALDDDCKTIRPYLKSDWPYGYKVTKEHIGHTCRVCSFHWRTDILPNDGTKRRTATENASRDSGTKNAQVHVE